MPCPPPISLTCMSHFTPSPHQLHPLQNAIPKTSFLPPSISPMDRASDMEGGRSKGTKDSIGEAGSPEPTSDDPGIMRPYYECMFCKRGFTNAQALGGHMNIHRKDRPRMQHVRKVMSSVSGKSQDYSEGYGYHIPYSYHNRAYSQVSESLKNYSFCLPESSSGGRESMVAEGDDMCSRRQRGLSLVFGQELHLGLGMHFDGSSGVYEEEKRKDADDGEELDLELRLGHHP